MTTQISTEELAELWADHDQDIIVGDDGIACCGNKVVAEADTDGNADYPAIRAWCEGAKYWPNIWQVNDHGNVELYDLQGDSLGGLV